MNIPREVLLDLLPVYLAGEASPATRALLEARLAEDPAFAEHVRALRSADVPRLEAMPRAELELESLRRTRASLGLQRWLFALAITFSALSLSTDLEIAHGRVTRARLLLTELPGPMAAFLALALVSWAGYALGARRLRGTR